MRRATSTLHSFSAMNATASRNPSVTHAARLLSSSSSSLQHHLISFPLFRKVNIISGERDRIRRCCSTMGKRRENTRYGEEDYWEQRYSEEAFMTFDWYQNYIDLQPILKTHIPKSGKVMMAGCGNSVMSEDMVKDGYTDVVNVDYSSNLINALKFRYKHLPQLSHMAMDVRKMSFADESFDAAIDKGLVDAMVCATNGPADVIQMLREMHRILKPGGNFIMVTYGFPLARMAAFMETKLKWKVNLWVFAKPYSGRTLLSSYPKPIPMEVQNWIGTKKEDYEASVIFVYVATKI